MEGIGLVERAFQLAPECGSLDEVRERLRGEGYFHVNAHLEGKKIRYQLRDRLKPKSRD